MEQNELIDFDKLEKELKALNFDVDSKRDNGCLIIHKPDPKYSEFGTGFS